MNKEITSERLTEVIKVDTTSSSKADFLATHVPFRHIKLKHGGGLSQDFETISEDEIWQQYVREPGERHQFIVVQGANGAGKSHLIRWLYTKFQAQPQENEAVIFIRRSDNSLKGAIRQLLDRPETRDLPHRDTYERLAAAGTDINPQELKHRLYHALLAKVQTDIV
ncbi:MAG: ATP-binding protein, partial [Pseudobutyrivibrio sp.]|nr:ATP-binding protein [Pseudobutyrivibrio sp.]